MVVLEGAYLMTPILPLEQMHHEEGLLVKVGNSYKGRDSLVIRASTGEEHLYRGNLKGVSSEELEKCIGQPVTIWSQQIYEAWPPFAYEGFRELKQGNKILLHYDNGATRMQMHPIELFWFRTYLVLAIVPVLLVGFACSKK